MLQSIVCGIITIFAVLALIVIAAYIEMPTMMRILIIVLSAVLAVAGIGTAVSLDIHAGYFECPHCKRSFVPTTKEYVKGIHTVTRRRLKCPECGETSMCKHRIVR